MNSNSNQQQISFYIPRMSNAYDKKQVKAIFKHLNIGKVKRVDFTPLNKKPGFIENYDTQNKSAFVHMELLYPNDLTQRILQIVFIQTSSYKIYPENNNMYWLLLKNNYPIQDTMMNKHQIVENCRYLESIIQEQADIIKKLEDKVDGIQQVVYQLIGGLFCPNTQEGIYAKHSNILFQNEPSLQIRNTSKDTSKWGYKPTTRQGDSNENRIELLESQMKSATKLLFILTGEKMESWEETEDLQSLSSNTEDLLEQDHYRNQHHNEDLETTYSYSTHSSMPSLIENYDEDCNSESSLERRRISSELCGNE
jgi:hypothetical protein